MRDGTSYESNAYSQGKAGKYFLKEIKQNENVPKKELTYPDTDKINAFLKEKLSNELQ